MQHLPGLAQVPQQTEYQKGTQNHMYIKPETIIVPDMLASPVARRAFAPTEGTARKRVKDNRQTCSLLSVARLFRLRQAG